MKPTPRDSVDTPLREAGQPLFTDAAGRRYRIFWYDADWEAHLLYRGRRVGRVTLEWDAPRLKLADIKVYLAYRGRGLGSAALQAIITLARQKGVTEITAFIVHKDLARMPYLPEWYARRGFRVTPSTSDSIAYDLCLPLGPEG
jgi:GNAT superfamily N-acetyltransferase